MGGRVEKHVYIMMAIVDDELMNHVVDGCICCLSIGERCCGWKDCYGEQNMPHLPLTESTKRMSDPIILR